MLDIKTWLETTVMKVSEDRFLKPPALPYVVFTEGANISGADDKNCIADRNISIELYSNIINHSAEHTIEILLNEKSLEYKKDRTWISTESFFETTYDFNLVEKF